MIKGFGFTLKTQEGAKVRARDQDKQIYLSTHSLIHGCIHIYTTCTPGKNKNTLRVIGELAVFLKGALRWLTLIPLPQYWNHLHTNILNVVIPNYKNVMLNASGSMFYENKNVCLYNFPKFNHMGKWENATQYSVQHMADSEGP